MHTLLNNERAVFNMGLGSRLGDPLYMGILEGCSGKELRILKKHPDLIAQIKKIAQLDGEEITDRLETEHNLEITGFGQGRICINVERVEEKCPQWLRSDDLGWFKDTANNEFLNWARHFLTQGIRVELWARYVEHKKTVRQVLDTTYL